MSGGKDKRKEIDRGAEQQAQLTREAMARQQPFVDQGYRAVDQMNAFAGLGSPDQQQAARNAFEGSIFNELAMGDYERDRGRIGNALGSQGLAFSSAFLNADSNAYANARTNAFANYLNNTGNLANIGVGATGAQTNLLAQQGNAAMNAGLAKAGTHQGFLGNLEQVSRIGSNIGNAFGGF